MVARRATVLPLEHGGGEVEAARAVGAVDMLVAVHPGQIGLHLPFDQIRGQEVRRMGRREGWRWIVRMKKVKKQIGLFREVRRRTGPLANLLVLLHE